MGEKIESGEFGGIAEHVTRWIAIASVCSLIASIIFDMGYFDRLGVPLTVAPTSLSDHGRSALVCVPFVMLFTLVYFFWVPLLVGLIKLFESTLLPSVIRRLAPSRRTYVYTGLILLCVWLLGGEKYSAAGVWGVGIIWVFGFVRGFISEQNLRDINKRQLARIQSALIVFPLVVLTIFGLGRLAAAISLQRGDFLEAKLIVKGESPVAGGQHTVLRSFERFYLVRNPHGIVSILRTDEVVAVELVTHKVPSFPGLGCLLDKECKPL